MQIATEYHHNFEEKINILLVKLNPKFKKTEQILIEHILTKRKKHEISLEEALKTVTQTAAALPDTYKFKYENETIILTKENIIKGRFKYLSLLLFNQQ